MKKKKRLDFGKKLGFVIGKMKFNMSFFQKNLQDFND